MSGSRCRGEGGRCQVSAEGVLSGARILARLGAEVSGRIWPVPGHLSYRSWQLALVSLTRLAEAGRAMTDVEAAK